MPVIVVGADCLLGQAIIERLAAPEREVRAFISSAEWNSRFREIGVKVAIGDLSDQSHVASAATACFTMVLVQAALTDGRELAFDSPEATGRGWAQAAREAGVRRVIWVGADPPVIEDREFAVVKTGRRLRDEIAAEVAELDDQAELSA